MKIIFMGTPDFAVSALESLCENGYEVILAVTQPDRQKGRGRRVIEPPVKQYAESRGIPVWQPARIRDADAVEKIRALAPDIIIAAAFGQILPQEILDIPRLGCVNIHASLLPRLRGAAPIQWAVINGDPESGVTLMQMNAGLDTGDIIAQERISLDPQETSQSLYGKLARLGGEMIVRCLPLIESQSIQPQPQDEEKSTYAPILRKEMGEIDWSGPVDQIERKVRGMLPWPGAFTRMNGHVLKLFQSETVSEREAAGILENARGAAPGTILAKDRTSLYVLTGDGILRILELQLEGKKRMDTGAFLRGTRVETGTVLG